MLAPVVINPAGTPQTRTLGEAVAIVRRGGEAAETGTAAAVLADYVAGNMTVDEIQGKHHVSAQRLYRILRDAHAPRRNRPPIEVTPRMAEIMVASRRQGIPIAEIAYAAGVGRFTVQRILWGAGLRGKWQPSWQEASP